MTQRRVAVLLLLVCLLPLFAACSDAPRTALMACSKADDQIKAWNAEDVRFCNYFYSSEYSESSKTYTVKMRAYSDSAIMLSRAIVQESVEQVWEILQDECFANRREIKLILYVYDFSGDLRYSYDGKVLTFHS